jgi:hypothetical protein
MATDYDIKTYFSPNFSGGFGGTVGWKRPWELAYLNLGGGNDTLPGVHQYIPGQRFENGLRLEVDSIDIVKTLDQGAWARIEYTTASDRDVYEVVDNEGTGHMLPRMKFPYRAWEINLKAKADGSFPSPALFRGRLSQVSVNTKSDVKIANQQDGVFKVELDFESFDTFRLRKDVGVSLWHHRNNVTTDGYHWGFFSFDSITFDDIITRVVAWMNEGRTSVDTPHTYSYTPKGVSPYNLNIFNPIPKSLTGTVTFTNGSTAVSGSGTAFTSELAVGQLIAPDANITGSNLYVIANWGKISSITNDTNLVLTANYGGTSRAAAASSGNINTIAIAECKDRATWDILRDVLQYMGGLEGLGKKYIPTCSITGVIDTTFGGFDKTASAYTDFRTEQNMEKNTSTDMITRFNLIEVQFTATNDAEYWIKFTLYRKNGAAWDTVLTIPASGYEYVPYDANNVHGSKWYSFPTQEITPEDTYKWDADLVTGGSFVIVASGSHAYSPASYNYLNSPSKIKFGNIRTLAVTQGKCSQCGIYHSSTNLYGCKDGGTVAGGGNNKCPDTQACYPDPSITTALTGTPTFTNASATVTGVSTLFSTELHEGSQIKLNADAVWVTVRKINSNLSLSLTANYSGTGGSGASTKKEWVPGNFGVFGVAASYADISNKNSFDTLCRLNSKRIYECSLNVDTSIREPIEMSIEFKDGYTEDIVGRYLNVYSPELDAVVMIRCSEQRHYLSENRVNTTIKGFRI